MSEQPEPCPKCQATWRRSTFGTLYIIHKEDCPFARTSAISEGTIRPAQSILEAAMDQAVGGSEQTNLIIVAYRRAAAAEERMTGVPFIPWEDLPKEKQAFYLGLAVFIWTLLKKL